MKAQLRALYGLQLVDLQISEVKKSLDGLDNGDKLRKQLAQAESGLTTLKKDLKKSETDLFDSELSLKSVEEKRKTLDKKLYAGGITNPKELSSIEKEIAALGNNRAELDERILGLYETVELRQADVNKVAALIETAKQRLAKITSEFQSKSEELNVQLQQLGEDREKALARVTDKPLLQRYESIRLRNKDSGIALVEGGKCGGCHVGLTSYTLRAVKEDEQYQTCESCGRILFFID